MFTLIPRGKKGLFSAVWWEKQPDGTLKQQWKATGTSNRKLAKEMAELWVEASQEKRISERFKQRTLELTRRLSGRSGSLTVRDWFKKWIEERTPEVRPSTLAYFKGKTQAFMDYLESVKMADADLGAIDARHIQGFRDADLKRVTAATVNHSLKCLRMVFKAACERGLIMEDPTKTVKTFKKSTQEQEGDETRRAFEVAELQAVLKVCNEEWQSLVMFGVYTGQRLHDIAKMKWKQVDVATGMIHFKSSKTRRIVRCPLPAPLHDWLLTQTMPDDERAPVHPLAFKAGSSTLSGQFGDILAAAGLRKKIPRTASKDRVLTGDRRTKNELSFHSLRHTYVTWLKMAGASSAVAMDAVGHDSAGINEHYTHVDDDTKKRFADLLPRL